MKAKQERKQKRLRYQNMGVKYYIIYDTGLHIYKTSLHAYHLKDNTYVSLPLKHIRNKRLWFDDLKNIKYWINNSKRKIRRPNR